MDRLKQIETLVSVATRGSLTAAALVEGVAPAVIGRRIDALESRLGVKLMVRTTRRITLTHEGSAFLEDCQRITAPAGFGRRHVAPLVPRFLAQHPDVSVSLNLSDRVVDIVNEGFDCAVRVGDLSDSSLVSVRLADNRRLCVAAPAYLQRAGVPHSPAELSRHECLTLSSEASQTRFGLRVSVSATSIYAVCPQRKHLPLRMRLWIDFIKHSFGDPTYWAVA